MDKTPNVPDYASPAAATAGAGTSRGNISVVLTILLVAVLFLAMVGALYRSWYRMTQMGDTATAMLVVQGCELYEGARVLVAERQFTPQQGVLLSENDYVFRFRLTPGRYTIRIELDGDVLVYRPDVNFPPHQYALLSLPKEIPPGADRPQR